MNILHSVRSALSPIHREGYPFIALFFAAAILLGFLWQPLFWAGLALTAWCAYFFRDPKRAVPLADNIAVSPADGKVSFAGLAVPPADLGLGSAALLRVSVFMDIFSCHVNRAPMRGVVRGVTYRKGRFFNAELDKASEANEANSLRLETAYGTVGVVQIAGLAARRIVCWAGKGSALEAGQRFGLIRFGSRLDIYLPAEAALCVGLGQSMTAGETVLAVFAEKDNSAERESRAAPGGAAADFAAKAEAMPPVRAVSQFRLD